MNVITSKDYLPPQVRNMNGYNHNLSEPRQSCGRSHDREWESVVNGRAKPRAVTVPTLTQTIEDVKRDKTDRTNARLTDRHNAKNIKVESKIYKSSHSKPQMDPSEKLIYSSSNRIGTSSSKNTTNQSKQKQAHVEQFFASSNPQRTLPSGIQKVKGVVGYQSRVDYVGGSFVGHDSGVFGMFSETKYAFAVNGLPGNSAQTSAAAAFFAR